MESIGKEILEQHREISCPNWPAPDRPCDHTCPRCRGWGWIVVRRHNANSGVGEQAGTAGGRDRPGREIRRD